RRIIELEHWGCPFSRTIDGKIAQRPFGGAGFPRTCYAADKTGMMLLHTLYGQIVRFRQAAERKELVLYNEWLVTALVIEDGECRGVIALELATGKLEAFQSEVVIFATGGSGRIYGNSTNALINTGMGMAVPYWAGIPLKDMEFVQFHPTTLVGSNILMTEGCRGEGGYLINNKGERFLAKYPDSKKDMEVAPRDIISRNILKEIMAGGGFDNKYVLLDLRHLGAEKITSRLPGIRDICMSFLGLDPITDPIPIQPGQHYTMGGIDCNKDCETKVKGFYAAGEASCVSVHGANRLGGNSLLETVVFGAVAGENAAVYIRGKKAVAHSDTPLQLALKQKEEDIKNIFNPDGKERPSEIKDELNKVMADKVGIFREASGLKEALDKVNNLQERYKKIKLDFTGKGFNYDLMWAIELSGSLDVAIAIVVGALARKESRGSHFRTDFPKRDDKEWFKHTLAFYSKEGVRIEHCDVTLGPFKPEERKY
ncbi:MAG: FAD-binding protein, partial [Planctomycetes bacterium]|nr:FAD-binding protein [Planctomycetota bacterium]